VVGGGGFEKETGGSGSGSGSESVVSSLIDVVIRHEPGDEHRPDVTEHTENTHRRILAVWNARYL
jgi:hypothetical protein